MILNILIFLFIIHDIMVGSVSKKIIFNSKEKLVIQLEINAITASDLYPTKIMIGLPSKEIPQTNISFGQKKNIEFWNETTSDVEQFYWSNQQELQNLETAILSINPVDGNGSYFKEVTIQLDFDDHQGSYRHFNKNEKILLKSRIINWDVAKNWIKRQGKQLNRMNTYPEGQWATFQVYRDGILEISSEHLLSTFSNLNQKDPRSFKLFMSKEMGRSRTQKSNQTIPENLVEMNILIVGENDGKFDSADKIIFFSRGSSGYDTENGELVWHQNLYFNSNTIWLLIPDDDGIRGKRIQILENPQEIDLIQDYGNVSYHFQTDLINPKASGTDWYGNTIKAGGSQSVITNLVYPKLGVSTKLKVSLKGNSAIKTVIANHKISIHHTSTNGDQIGNAKIWSGNAIRTISESFTNISLVNGNNFFHVVNSSNDNNSLPYLDYFEIEYGRELNFDGNYEFFTNVINQNIRFIFKGNQTDSYKLWDISQPSEPKEIIISSNGFADWSGNLNMIGRFVFFDSENLTESTHLNPFNGKLNTLRNQTINADYIIIGPDEFKASTGPILETRNPAIFASLETIYNEFSAGNPDPMAIRTFIQWTQENWIPPSPFALLLLGDSGFDYRNILGNSSIIVPTVQVSGSRSYATDDRFATIYGNLPEIALGRYPARTIKEVDDFVDKVIAIENEPELGPWRQTVTLIADDAARPEPSHGSISTGKSHTLNSEQLAEIIPPSLYIDKLYMMEYPEVSDASAYGVIKPDATNAIFEKLRTGTSIISYIGHGSPYQLAQEKLLYLDRGDINSINTGFKLPLWIVGTCSFGHFDDPQTESFAEELIRQPLNAASMVISTTRAITVTGNERYTQNLFQTMFPGTSISNIPVGIILQSIKDGTSESEYFHLFGDPAMSLPLPMNELEIYPIQPDTLRTLSTANFSGQQNFTNNHGNGVIILLDAEKNITREYSINSEDQTLSYSLPGATLFRGKFSFNSNNFSGRIRIPQDISYSTNSAQLMIYLFDGMDDASGYIKNIQLVGGEATTDKKGPLISFETTDGLILRSGDHFSNDGVLTIRISDPIGINVTNETGHEITLVDILDGTSEVVTQKFYYDTNSITTGTVQILTYDKDRLEYSVKAWDNANNFSEYEIKLFKSVENSLKIYNAYNFPNPFTSLTQFAFEITATAEIKLDVYSIGGRHLKSFDPLILPPGYHFIDWDGKDEFGGQLANGVYLYKIKAINKDNTQTHIGRCAKFQ